jgi:hypothetical protein
MFAFEPFTFYSFSKLISVDSLTVLNTSEPFTFI